MEVAVHVGNDSNKSRDYRSEQRLLNVECSVCGDRSSGKHYGVFTCDGCSGFFKRSIHKQRNYVCKSAGDKRTSCTIDKMHRNQCRACRLQRCFQVNMNKDAVQHERGPRKPKQTGSSGMQQAAEISCLPPLQTVVQQWMQSGVVRALLLINCLSTSTADSLNAILPPQPRRQCYNKHIAIKTAAWMAEFIEKFKISQNVKDQKLVPLCWKSLYCIVAQLDCAETSCLHPIELVTLAGLLLTQHGGLSNEHLHLLTLVCQIQPRLLILVSCVEEFHGNIGDREFMMLFEKVHNKKQ